MVNFHDIARRICCYYPASANPSWQEILESLKNRGVVSPLPNAVIVEHSSTNNDSDFLYVDYLSRQQATEQELCGSGQPAAGTKGEDRRISEDTAPVVEPSHLDSRLFGDWRPTMGRHEARVEGTDEADEALDESDTISIIGETEGNLPEQTHTNEGKLIYSCDAVQLMFMFSTTWKVCIEWMCLVPLIFICIRQNADFFCLLESMVMAFAAVSCFKYGAPTFKCISAEIERLPTSTIAPVKAGALVSDELYVTDNNTLELRQFRVLDDQSLQYEMVLDRYRSDRIWVLKFTGALTSKLRTIDFAAYEMCRQINLSPTDIYYQSRESWWATQLCKIQDKVLQNQLQAALHPDLLYRHRYAMLDAIKGLYDCHENALLPPIDTWPHRPVFARLVLSDREIQKTYQKIFRWHSDEYIKRFLTCKRKKEEVERQHSDIYNAMIGTEEVHESDFEMAECPIPVPESLDLFINTKPGYQSAWTAVKAFDTDLFSGRVLMRLSGINTSKHTNYFSKRRRNMQVVFQGSFNRRLPLETVYTGQVWEKRFDSLPNNFVTKMVQMAISTALPSVKVDFNATRPYLILPLVASMQTIIVQKKSETIVDITDINLEESSAGLDGNVDSSTFWSHHKNKRRRYFSNPLHLQTKYLEPNYVYTFETYQHLFEPSTFSMKMAFCNINIAQYIKGQPVEINAFVPPFDRSGTPIFDTSPEYIWRCQIAHENQLTK